MRHAARELSEARSFMQPLSIFCLNAVLNRGLLINGSTCQIPALHRVLDLSLPFRKSHSYRSCVDIHRRVLSCLKANSRYLQVSDGMQFPRMKGNLKTHLIAACRRLLQPLVRILLRYGMSYGEFSEVVKSVYVEIAREDFTPPGEKPTDSRVAILTGLTRKDVKRLREAGGEPKTSSNVNRATRVLSGWYQDADFTGPDGQPIPLILEGKLDSFTALVRRYSGDMPPKTMLEELQRVHAVERTDDGKIHVLSRAYLPDYDDPSGIHELGAALHDLAATIDHNLNPQRRGAHYFQRMVSNERVRARSLPVFRRIVGEHGQQLLETLDDWLNAHEVSGAAHKDKAVRTGVGIYFFQDTDDSDER